MKKITPNKKINLYTNGKDFFLHYFPDSTTKYGYKEKITKDLIKQFTKTFKHPIKTKILPEPIVCDHCMLDHIVNNGNYIDFRFKYNNKELFADYIVFLIPNSNKATPLCKNCYDSFKSDFENCIEIYNEKITSEK